MKKSSAYFIFVSILLLTSCEKHQEIESIEQTHNQTSLQISTLLPTTVMKGTVSEKIRGNAYTENQEQLANQYEEIAQQLALNLDNADLREFILSESKKMYHGDYYFPLAIAKEQKIKGKTLKSLLASKNKTVSQAESENRIDEIVSNDSKIIIGVPIEILKWNPKTHKLLVAASPVTEKASVVKAFNSEGKVYYLDGKKDPDVPVIIVGQDDRPDYLTNTHNVSINNKKNLRPAFLRASGGQDKIAYIECPDISAIESWWYGGPELRFNGAVYFDGSNSAVNAFVTQINPPRYMAVDGFPIEIGLFEWYFDDNHGPDYYIQSFEIDDDGTTQSLTVGVSAGKKDDVSGTASFSFTYKGQDKVLKGELIHYTSQLPKVIADSQIIFEISQW